MYCVNCGKQLSADQSFCPSCGTARSKPTPAVASDVLEPASRPPSDLPYAGFWQRFLGWLIDYFVSLLATVLIVAVVGKTITGNDSRLTLSLLYLVFPLLYASLMESSSLQATLGKLAVGIKVCDLQGNRISFARAVGRFLAHILDGLTLGIGFGMAAFTARRQALHDMVAGTLVTRRAFASIDILEAGRAATSGLRTAGVVIGVLLFGPFGIGVLAAIAIPAYQNYTIRAQVTEGLIAADSYKAAVAEAVTQSEDWSKIDSQSLGIAPITGKYFKAISVQSGAVVIEYGNSANAKINGNRIVFIPGLNANRDIVWVCGRANIPPGISMAIENGARYTTVGDAYLPMSCRTP
jgi:uncharacterized RDD family membrane protein YckC/Tfp pilus assembly major pilin PilA